MAQLVVSFNGKDYVVANRQSGPRRGNPIYSTEMVAPSQDSINISGLPRLSNVPGVSTLVFPNFMDGFGRDRIDSDSAFDKAEYRRCYYATCDIRWARQQYLPILEAESDGDEDVIRASESYKSNLWSIWDDVSGTTLASRKYDGSEATWIAGGNAEAALAVDATSSGTGSSGTTLTVAHACGTGNDRLLVVAVSVSDDSTDSETTIPTGVTYNSVAMTKLSGNTINISGADQIGSSLWYLSLIHI